MRIHAVGALRRFLPPFAALLALAGCEEPRAFVPPPPPPVTVASPTVERVTVYAESPGRIESLDSVRILARVHGFIDQIHFSDGQFVEKDQVLLVIEPEEYEADVARAEAALASAEAALELAETRVQRVRDAEAQGAARPIEVLETTAERDDAAAKVKEAGAALDAARLQLSYTQVRSPLRGRISERLVSVGDYVSEGGQSALAEVTSLEPVYAYTNPSERAILSFVRQGRRIPLSEDGRDIPESERVRVKLRLADESVYAHEGWIDYAAPTIDRSTGTLRVRVRVPNPDLELIPGQFVRVMVASFDGEATLVPEVAVLRDVVGPYLLSVGPDGVAQRRDVALGEQVGAKRIIASGVGPEDTIIVEGVQRARPGRPVDPKRAEPDAGGSAEAGEGAGR